jgi:hypothetical protein
MIYSPIMIKSVLAVYFFPANLAIKRAYKHEKYHVEGFEFFELIWENGRRFLEKLVFK